MIKLSKNLLLFLDESDVELCHNDNATDDQTDSAAVAKEEARQEDLVRAATDSSELEVDDISQKIDQVSLKDQYKAEDGSGQNASNFQIKSHDSLVEELFQGELQSSDVSVSNSQDFQDNSSGALQLNSCATEISTCVSNPSEASVRAVDGDRSKDMMVKKLDYGDPVDGVSNPCDLANDHDDVDGCLEGQRSNKALEIMSIPQSIGTRTQDVQESSEDTSSEGLQFDSSNKESSNDATTSNPVEDSHEETSCKREAQNPGIEIETTVDEYFEFLDNEERTISVLGDDHLEYQSFTEEETANDGFDLPTEHVPYMGDFYYDVSPSRKRKMSSEIDVSPKKAKTTVEEDLAASNEDIERQIAEMNDSGFESVLLGFEQENEEESKNTDLSSDLLEIEDKKE